MRVFPLTEEMDCSEPSFAFSAGRHAAVKKTNARRKFLFFKAAPMQIEVSYVSPLCRMAAFSIFSSKLSLLCRKMDSRTKQVFIILLIAGLD